MTDYDTKVKHGMYKTQKDYENWSGGLWAHQAPEYLLTTYIGQELSKIRDRPFYLTLEQHVGQALREAGASKKIISEAGKQKFDIMIWWGSSPYLPRGIIEVKKQINSFTGYKTGGGGIKKDIDRIHNLRSKCMMGASLAWR